MKQSERRGLEGLYKMDLTRVCEMIIDYASHESIIDLDESWQEVRETLDALLVIRRLLKEG